MHYLPRESLVNWVPWANLISPSLTCGLLPPKFKYYFTLRLFRDYHSPVLIDVEHYAAKVVSFAQTSEGEERTRTYEFVKLVAAASNWGYYGSWTNDDVLHLAKMEVNNLSL